MRRLTLVLLLVGLGLLAGCAEPTGPPVDPRSVPETAPAEAGDGGYNLTLAVQEPDGAMPIENAAVIVYWGSDDEGDEDGVRISGSAEGDSSGGSVDGVVRVSNPSTPKPDTTLAMRTNEEGRATAHVPENRRVGIVAWAPSYTEEWIPSAATGDDGTGGPVDFLLYKAELTATLDDSLEQAGVSPGRITNSNYDWYPEVVPWGESNHTRQGYVERLESLRLTLTWTNGPQEGGGGDLSIGAGTTASDPDLVQESDDAQASPGEHIEEAALNTGEIEELGWPSSDRLYVGPATSSAYVGPLWLDYELTVHATFDPFASAGVSGPNDAPLPSASLLVAVLASSALVLARRRDA